jgi:hypothetical protein
MILISRTYETWTPDDIEAGETNNQGFEFTDEPVTFRELVDMIGREGFFHPSCSPRLAPLSSGLTQSRTLITGPASKPVLPCTFPTKISRLPLNIGAPPSKPTT